MNKPKSIIPGKTYVVSRKKTDDFDNEIPWGNHVAKLHYPTWDDLQGAHIIPIKRTYYDESFEVWKTQSVEHGFTFYVSARFIYELDNLCKCALQLLMCRGCQCGGA